MSAAISLPVLIPKIPGQRWSCHSCGDCCRTLVGHLFPEEVKRIDGQGWGDSLGAAPYVRVGRGMVLNKHADGACVFLDGENRCRIHAKFGEAAKPLACRIFPFSVRPVKGGWRAAFRFDCPSAAASKGLPLAQHQAWVSELAARLGHKTPVDADAAALQRGVWGTAEEVELVLDRVGQWMQGAKHSLNQRLRGLARLTATLAEAKLGNVRGGRLGELVEMLLTALPQEAEAPAAPTTRRQRGLLRQLAFAHAEFATLGHVRSGVVGRMRKRWEQFRGARVFRQGDGVVPPLPGLERTVRFEKVEGVSPAFGDRAVIDDLTTRYVMARLAGRTVCGAGYYHWTLTGGLRALCLSVAAAGWLARLHAAHAERDGLRFEDAAYAIGAVDRAATRLPSLGTAAERARAVYLGAEDGVARLLHEYALTSAHEGTQP